MRKHSSIKEPKSFIIYLFSFVNIQTNFDVVSIFLKLGQISIILLKNTIYDN